MAATFTSAEFMAMRKRALLAEQEVEQLTLKAAENRLVFLTANANWADERMRLETELAEPHAGCGCPACNLRRKK